jgi:beta-glucosidase
LGVLPLSRRDPSGGVLVLGPTAVAPYIDGGGSSHVTLYDPAIGPYEALRTAAGPGARLSYRPGYDLDGQLVPSNALSAPDPAAGYPNWTLIPADAAFAGQPGLLRQQTTTDPVAPGAQPVLYTGPAPHPTSLTARSTTPPPPHSRPGPPGAGQVSSPRRPTRPEPPGN